MDVGTCFNTLRPKQNGWRFAEHIFEFIFLNENLNISNKISLHFVASGSFSQKVSTGSGDGLVPHRQQAIIWTNDDLVSCCHMAWLSPIPHNPVLCYVVLLSHNGLIKDL